ncbi:hypothetical protein EVAR_14150_1 [Eumeta japonica]|uniref:Uncharacterized protein n=1 Tax=Eumeta variegata TaxID=151549 RepID=A0A4C1UFC4_EUMVA|nr:hypothetical protein EVAR_14150_1 [Eumeta japonica]
MAKHYEKRSWSKDRQTVEGSRHSGGGGARGVRVVNLARRGSSATAPKPLRSLGAGRWATYAWPNLF